MKILLDECVPVQARNALAGRSVRMKDSEPEAEFQETVNQSKAMLKAVALAGTFARAT